MENITLNAIYNRPLAIFSEIVELITLSIQLIMAPIIIYVVFQNKQIKIYRYYLINTIFWNTLSQIGNTLFSFSILTPYSIFVINSALESYIDRSTFYTLACLWVVCLVATLFGVLIAATYRFLYLLNLFESTKFIDNPVKLAIILAIAPLSFFIIVWIILNISRESILSEESDIALSKTLPLVYKELQGRTYLGLNNVNFIFPLAVIGGSIILFCILVVSIIPMFFLKRAKQKWHANTYKLQVKLYKAVLIQLWAMSFLTAIPVLLICLFVWLRIQNTIIFSQLFVAIGSLHGPLDLTIIGFYIPSHRIFFIQVWDKFLRRFHAIRSAISNGIWGSSTNSVSVVINRANNAG